MPALLLASLSQLFLLKVPGPSATFIHLLTTQNLYGFSGGSVVKNLPASAEDNSRHEFNPWVGKISWRRKRQYTSILAWETHGEGNLEGYSPQGGQGPDMTEHTHTHDPHLSSVLTYADMLLLFSRVWLIVTPWTIAHQAPLSTGFPRKEYWSGLPFPPPEDLPNAGIEPASPGSPAGV